MHKNRIAEFLSSIATEELDIESGVRAVEDGKSFILGFSGKRGSGKDTIGALVAKALRESGDEIEFARISQSLRAEANRLISMFRNNPAGCLATLRDAGVSEEGRKIAHDLCKAVLDRNVNATAWDRNNEVTALLQALGNGAIYQDEEIWDRLMVKQALELLSAGKVVIVTDIRFPRDAHALHLLDGKIFRLDVSPEVQKQRIMARDKVVSSPEILNHPSETALDDYPAFSLRIDTDNKTPEEIVGEVLEYLGV